MERRQERFIFEYLRTANATEAYRNSGYKPSSDAVAASSAWRLLRNEKVQQRLSELRGALARDTIACAAERAEMLSFIMRSNEAKVADRLKAIDLLNKMENLYVSKLAGADGGPMSYTVAWASSGKSDEDDEDDEAEDDE